ncbi:hypothetical protein BDN70DRAFT_882027 [Pholiota conissans]|uniref:Uncharacterized protein n=1 Tax=Pholiota conissans TaxID=109636 RepID=A0A9P5YVT6_9AGAR|nr:hypothetical protein BDN70DRAFT_882027 [Pholiota conissans]
MTEPRLSTVFDYSDLRLHPNGTRVYQKSSNRRPVLAKVTVQDARANWIAKDAGGSARVPRYRRRTTKESANRDEGAEEIDISRDLEQGTGIEKFKDEEAAGQASGEEGSEVSNMEKKRKGSWIPDQRRFKRQRFEAEYDYLDASKPPLPNAVSEGESSHNGFPSAPSPDLLKVIHKFASEFYTERGQLLNISREYRKERKQRALARKAKLLDGGSSRSGKKEGSTSRSQSASSPASSEEDPSEHNISGDEANIRQSSKGKGKERQREDDADEDDDDEEEEEEENEDDKDYNDESEEIESYSEAESKKFTAKRKKRSKSSRKESVLYTDMYKVFDGSAMMALGMLVQEHIASLLNPEVPELWVKEAKRVYTNDAGSSDEEEIDQPVGEGDEEEDDDDDLDDIDEEEGGDKKDEDEKEDEQSENQDELEEDDEEEEKISEDGYDEQDELSVDEEDNDQQDDGANGGDIAKDDRFEHGNENEYHVNPYSPASSSSFRAQSNAANHVHHESFTSGERAPVNASGASGPIVEECDDDPIECTSDESMRSEATLHSDSGGEFI